MRSMVSKYSLAPRSMSSVSRSTKYDPPSGSIMCVTPLSCAMICCVRNASVAASAVGSESASSSEFVWSELVPPSTAASACNAVRTTLLYGCCAVSETPAVCVWNRSFHDRSFLAPKRSRITSAQILRAARNLAISSKKSLCELKKNEICGANASTSSPASMPYCTYSMPSRSVKASSCSDVEPASRM
jgi:hypothetical protein